MVTIQNGGWIQNSMPVSRHENGKNYSSEIGEILHEDCERWESCK